jgi:anaerobic selenocysteine-containing dehydrogenase
MLTEKLEELAAARGLTTYQTSTGQTVNLAGAADRLTLGGAVRDEDARWDEVFKDDAAYGILPPDASLGKLREEGHIRWQGWGLAGHGLAQASTIEPDETLSPFRWHVEEKQPYPTLTRRAQFYIDHEWFLEAGEELPCHKDDPGQGGDHEFVLTSGHPRWSVHSMNMTDNIIQNTHRGEPFVLINSADAQARGVGNGDVVELASDVGALQVAAKLSPSVRPGQVILYNGFEPYQHPGWRGQSDVEPGMVKWLHLAGGYGHLKYRPWHWQPVPTDRGVRVCIKPAGKAR